MTDLVPTSDSRQCALVHGNDELPPRALSAPHLSLTRTNLAIPPERISIMNRLCIRSVKAHLDGPLAERKRSVPAKAANSDTPLKCLSWSKSNVLAILKRGPKHSRKRACGLGGGQ